MAKFTVHKGKRYEAEISLGLLESLAGNDVVARQIVDAGFAEVEVTGYGREREAKALWPLEDATAGSRGRSRGSSRSPSGTASRKSPPRRLAPP
jgi:hypothetical protein